MKLINDRERYSLEVFDDAQMIEVDGIPRPIQDATGRLVASSPEGQIAFWRFYREGPVNDQGRPLVLFHSTTEDFIEFKIGDIGFHFGSVEAANKRIEDVRSGNAKVSMQRQTGSQLIIPAYVSIQNPLRMNDAGSWDDGGCVSNFVCDLMDDDLFYEKYSAACDILPPTDGVAGFREIFKFMGYDGIVYENVAEGGGDSYIAFDATQIKSALGNAGTYCRDNPEITDGNSFVIGQEVALISSSADVVSDEVCKRKRRPGI